VTTVPAEKTPAGYSSHRTRRPVPEQIIAADAPQTPAC
jgi:hypothetical protein